MTPFLALITPIGGGLGGPPGVPTHPWVPPYGPSHPIAPGGPPPRPWGPIEYPDQSLPGNQPYPDQGLPRPPLGTWGGVRPPYVDIGGPGPQPYPGQGLPGNQPYPDQGLPGQQPRPTHPIFYPPVIWDPSRPSNPIVNPGDPDNPGAGQGGQLPQIEWKSAWSPSTGWIVVGVPTGEHVTPSSEE